MANLLDSAVKRITVETAWLPPIVIDRPLAPAPKGATSVTTILQPKVTVETDYGNVVSKPWGEPVQNWPTLRFAFIFLGTLGTLYLLKRRLRRRRGVSGLGAAPQAVVRWAVTMTDDDVVVMPVQEARARGVRILTLRERQDDAIRVANTDYAYLRHSNPLHLSKRERGSSAEKRAKEAAYKRKWYAANKQKGRDANKRWRDAHPEQTRITSERYRRRHKRERADYQQVWYARHVQDEAFREKRRAINRRSKAKKRAAAKAAREAKKP